MIVYSIKGDIVEVRDFNIFLAVAQKGRISKAMQAFRALLTGD